MPEDFDFKKSVNQLWWSEKKESSYYAILDAARDEIIFSRITTMEPENVCLYRGEQALDLAEVAPYLVQLKENEPFTQWLLSNGWGKSWGVFLESEATLKQLKRHFRQFIIVYDETGTPLYFRYYDPRVFRVYIPTCNEEELDLIFGPVDRFFSESEDGSSLVEYQLVEGKLSERSL
jgi:hypothetical protein